jgi:hypothetical protein
VILAREHEVRALPLADVHRPFLTEVARHPRPDEDDDHGHVNQDEAGLARLKGNPPVQRRDEVERQKRQDRLEPSRTVDEHPRGFRSEPRLDERRGADRDRERDQQDQRQLQ